MFAITLLVSSVLGVLNLSSAQIVQEGQCNPNIELGTNFNFELFLNAETWFEIARGANPSQGGDCSSIMFSRVGDDVEFYNRAYNRNFLEELTGTVTNDGTSLTLNLADGDDFILHEFDILITNNENFAVAYRCENLDENERMVFIWQLGNIKGQPPGLMQDVINTALFNRLGINYTDLETVDHSEAACYELFVIPEGEPIVLSGQCDTDLEAVQNFNVEAFTGEWHEIASYYSENAQGTCPRAEYSLSSDGSSIDVVNSHIFDHNLFTISGNAVIDSDNSGRLQVTLEVEPDDFVTHELLILATDYTNYTVTYACVDVNDTSRRVYSWILARSRQPAAEVMTSINEVVDSMTDLNNAYYQDAARSDDDCFYYPEPTPGSPVIFRGRCDTNITAVPDFQLNDYLGLWHDIESYSSDHQQGTCNNAYYSLNLETGDVDVLNTQVNNQALDSINGIATVVSDDGSGKLLVTFIDPDTNLTTEQTYWVLATNYDSYALVYSCEEIDENNRRVWSWKLSRTKELTEAATNAINDAITYIPVLNNTYYEPRNQTTEGCFFFPEPQSGVPVVFPGQCDDDITVANNFNLSAFEGRWIEIEAYPYTLLSGHCIEHNPQGTGSILNLDSSAILNQFQQITNGTITFESTADSAKLAITLNDLNITIPFWILAIDYDDFALAYSCINLEDRQDFRAIYSWKLSRTRSLSPEANTVINEVISDIEVLGDVYYEYVGQTEEDCFYLPDLEPGQPIILNGMCDQNIDVVRNFSAERYAGLWHLIESYPSAFQNGTCLDATYTLETDGTILVHNTQVIDQNLDTIDGVATLVETTDLSAKLLVNFPGATEASEYWVLDTDYDTYSLVYSCRNINSEQRQIWSWKLSRSRQLTEIANDAINEVINGINVLNNYYYEEIQNYDEDCFYYPEVDGNPLLFRGQCDLNVPVVSGFDISDYMGLWHVIQAYPSVNQPGTCNNAYYVLDEDLEVVNILNSQVVDENLDTISGLAVSDSDEGYAKLRVTFPEIEHNETGVMDYWVLATDYSNYALVYTCRDYGLHHRQVWSWKLSRTKDLSDTAQTAINNAIDDIDVLDQRYYVPENQSADGCFFFPEPQEGVPVVFPGQCDLDIAVKTDFNLSQFEGIWHEIEAYPIDLHRGQCINHEYSQTGDNLLGLESRSVENQVLYVTNSTLSSTDNSARLLLTLANGTTLPFWIIATDYDDYALAYSCTNHPERPDFKTVYSWKFSRSRTLSPEANDLINEAMDPIQVLHNQYYEPIQQTDEDCFFLPELSPNEPVVLIGQCDEEIPIISDFDAQAFAGRWFDIESYYDGYEGDCIDSSFIVNDNGFDIVFTQVIDQVLHTGSGQATIAADGNGKLIVNTEDGPSEYWILATDYDNYALVYSCGNLNNVSRHVRSWKLSRTRQLSNANRTTIDDIVDTINVLDEQYYNVRDHSLQACFYFPLPALGQPVRFRGECNDTIQVVADFRVEDYMEKWYSIESYPQQFQGGTCATAEYTLNEEGVLVYNTQVVNQLLDAINGSAVLDSDDGSAKLLVNFPSSGGQPSPYWILATDYVSYALVYSCSRIDDEYVSVGAWKLSRQQNLTEEANTAIEAAIADVTMLRQEYFEESGHSWEDCFFYPAIPYGESIILPGQCPTEDEFDFVTDFDAVAFTDTWHEISRFASELQTGDCASSSFSTTNQNDLFDMTQTIIYNERLHSATGSAEIPTYGRGIISLNLIGVPPVVSKDVYVLDVDYSEFALLYSCTDIDEDRKQIFSWKLSRSRYGLSQEANDRIDHAVAENIDLHEQYYQTTDQSNDGCFHYPEFDPLPDSIELPGPCDERIQGKANFTSTAYLGRWFEIARYPTPFQTGTCNQAEYSLVTAGFYIYNNEVVNQALEVINGWGTEIEQSGGTGVMNVSFVVDGETTYATYYVLETDYTSFALVYSCRNLDNGNRQVTSWKLGREREFTDEANAIIDGVISNTQGLIEDYFTPTSQSEEDCFYVPDVDEHSAPKFRGECEFTPMENFNIQLYLGWWHEMERYPVDDSIGECISSQFEQFGDIYRVVDTNVIGLSGNVTTAVVTVSSDGRLTRTFEADGRVVESWVLATDYQTYSLLYSCETIENAFGDTYRRVWSAKHSKIRELTDVAQSNMASIIEDNDVLYPQFFLEVDHSDSACFHYPEPPQFGERVILPGQCDTSIPLVENFDAVAYTGTWYLIERYSYPDVSDSTCIGTRYTLVEGGDEEPDVLNLISWEVVEEELETIEGTVTMAADGSGRLTFTLQTGEDDTVTHELYVLSTDYTVYSLLYSCENINELQRAVIAFKLSRTRNMPASGNTAIANVIAEREELHQPYFMEVEQDEHCEEPNSGLLMKSSIIVLLICALWQLGTVVILG